MQQAVTEHLFHVLLNECKAAKVPPLQRAKMNKLGAAAGTEKERCGLPAVCAAVMLVWGLWENEIRCWNLLKLPELLYKS